jgi:hypothetical protein
VAVYVVHSTMIFQTVKFVINEVQLVVIRKLQKEYIVLLSASTCLAVK